MAKNPHESCPAVPEHPERHSTFGAAMYDAFNIFMDANVVKPIQELYSRHDAVQLSCSGISSRGRDLAMEDAYADV